MDPQLESFGVYKERPGLYEIDILEYGLKTDLDPFRPLGQSIAKYLDNQEQLAFLVSTKHLEHFMSDHTESPPPNAYFYYDGKTFYITQIPKFLNKNYIPEITRSIEFQSGLHAWICLFHQNADIRDSVNTIQEEMAKLLPRLEHLRYSEVNMELIACIPDSFEVLWFKS